MFPVRYLWLIYVVLKDHCPLDPKLMARDVVLLKIESKYDGQGAGSSKNQRPAFYNVSG
ncbi:hypothetical protein SBDP1_1100001 [Syntrophobacter sp. SbD1]|nr:hypothetical protein SBDP1_1100001 [Syntrophobacter sp. SbD1]